MSGLMQDYGLWVYVILFLYCALKSGSLPLLAGYAAQAQLLDLSLVLGVTFAGGYLGDEARFLAARSIERAALYNGTSLLPLSWISDLHRTHQHKGETS